MFEFLDSFNKRMESIGIASSIINRKGKKTELESLFDENELTNIIVATLLFIMEQTLEENNQCELHRIEAFLDELLNVYHGKKLSRDKLKELASYIIRDILQNNGLKLGYTLMNYTGRTTEEIVIRLISDKIVEENGVKKIIYFLTNQGYEFLFRMREMDEEIQLTIEQLKLKEYIKRKKFSSAVRQSAELISFVRQKKKDIEAFVLSIRQNIHSVDVEKFEALIKSTYAMLTEEYDTMQDIQKMISMAEEKIKEEFSMSKSFEDKLYKAKSEIQEITHNIGVVITEQRDLIINRHSLTELYMDTIKKTFEFSFEKRYDFEQIILYNLERYENVLDKCITLLQPLMLPAGRSLMGIGQIFEPQTIIKEPEGEDTHLIRREEYDAFQEKERVRLISEQYTNILALFITEAIRKGSVSISEILEWLQNTDGDRDTAETRKLYLELMEGNRLLLTALYLYNIESIKISDFFRSKSRVLDHPTEEFSLEYCLTKLKCRIKGLEAISELKVTKGKGEVKITVERVLGDNTGEISASERDQEYDEAKKYKETIEMSDLIFEVIS